MDNFGITHNGKPLDKSKYTIDLENKVFISNRDDLVLDFTGLGSIIIVFLIGTFITLLITLC